MLQWDDVVSPVYKGLWDGASNIHLPLTEITKRQMHARLMQSIFFVNPSFFVDPQEDVDFFRVKKIESLMKYIITRYTNYHKGIYNAIDDFCSDLCNEGIGLLSRDWKTIQRRSLRVIPNAEYVRKKLELDVKLTEGMTEKEFDAWIKENYVDGEKPYKEEAIIKTFFDGPTLVAEDPAYILFKGNVIDSTDLDMHETVQKVCYFSRNDLLQFKDSGYFFGDVVDIILASKPDRGRGTMINSRTRTAETTRDMITGVKTVNALAEDDQWEFVCSYDTVNADGSSGPQDRIVHFVHVGTKQLARWTFMDRVTGNGKLPLHMAHLYRRPRSSYGRGIVQDLKPANDMLDILFNQGIDAGTLANMPMGLFRGNNTFDPDKFKIEPGVFLKADDPNTDVRVLQWGINPTWSMPFQSSIIGMANQQSSLSPMDSGIVGGAIGPLRSIGGVDRMSSNSEINRDVIHKRINLVISEVFEGLYADCLEKMPLHLRIPVMGMDGTRVFSDDGTPVMEDITKADLARRVHFGLYGNSMLTNREAQLDASMKMGQFLLQRVGLETGVVTAENVYEYYNELLTSMGKQRIERFITRPKGSTGSVSFEIELACIVQGVPPPIMLADPEHEKKVELYNEQIENPENLNYIEAGIVRKDLIKALEAARDQHQKFAGILQKTLSISNVTGAQQSPTLGLQEGQTPNPQMAEQPQPEGQQQMPQELAPEGL